MKKVLLAMVIALTMINCSPEDGLDCNCGRIVSDDAADYSVTIKNVCSGNLKRWTLAPSDWYYAYVGDDYCITNSTGW